MDRGTLVLIAMATYAVAFTGFTFAVGWALRSRGWVFLSHTFEGRSEVAKSVRFLLDLGFYLTCLGLLLWNLGIEPEGKWVDGQRVFSVATCIQTVAVRLGVSIFVVAAFHTTNILILSVLSRQNTK